MMTKLSRIDSSSSSLKYSVKTWRRMCQSRRTKQCESRPLTPTSLCRKVRISAAFEFFLVRATTVRPRDRVTTQISMAGTNAHLDKEPQCRRTVEVVVSDMEVVDSLTGEARGDIVTLFFLLEDEGEEALDGRRGDVVAVRALDQGLRFARKGGQLAAYQVNSAISPGCLSLAW